MGCCLSKTYENQDKIFDSNEHEEFQEVGSNQSLAGSFSTDSKTESGKYIIRLWPRKDRRQWVERIETNKDTIVLSVDPEADDEKIDKDRNETLMENGRRFLLE